MPDTYKNSQSEDNDASRARRLKIKKKKHLPFMKNKPKKFNEAIKQPMRGINNLGHLLRGLEMQLKERGREKAEDVPYSPEWFKKRAKRSDSMS